MFRISSHDCSIGIDIGTHSIRMLQFRRRGDQLAMQAACRVEIAPPGGAETAVGRLTAALRQGLANSPFSGKRAVLSLPPSLLHSRSVRLPQMPDSDLQQALQWEAKDRFGFEVGDGRIVWFRAGEVRRGTETKDELLLFAAEGDTLSLHLDAAAAAGLTVVGIDIAACAGYRGACRAGFDQPARGESLALLDIGHGSSQFIISRDDQLVFYKHIDIGAAAIDAAVAKKLGISQTEAAQMRARLAIVDAPGEEREDLADEANAAPLAQALRDAVRTPMEELSREIDMCMRYFVVTFRGARPELITITGRQACCPRIIENLSHSLALRVEPARPLRGVLDLGDIARPDRSSEWAVAAGLSLYSSPPARKEVAA